MGMSEGKFSVAQGGKDGDQSGEDKREEDSGAGVLRSSGASENEDTGANDSAYPQGGEVDRPE